VGLEIRIAQVWTSEANMRHGKAKSMITLLVEIRKISLEVCL
jgi:hypothetical protein